MDSNGMDQNGNNSDDISLEPSVPLNSYTKGVDGYPVTLPRIGIQYQAKIAAIMSISESISYKRNPLEDENKDGPCDFAMRLPISVIWANQEVRPNKDRKVNFLSDSNRSRQSEHNVESVDVLEEKTDEIKGFLAPGLSGNSWSDAENASFLLGLYIFGKNFVQVKKFVETKNMGEIQFCYYAKFCKTPEKRRWSVDWKGRTRKCVPGKKLFEGLRHQELRSRLVLGLSKELQDAVWQASMLFSEGKIGLEDYVFSLKNMVGMTTLIEAVGIGQGSKDLTGRSIAISPELPTEKACSTLGPKEIIKILTGDTKLSRARSSELFWEAVWPILVNKGWKETGSSSSKQSHVFFAPDVPKSSPRKNLVKGEQYFDSIADVLNLAASTPGILDLDKKVDEGTEKTEEDGIDNLLEKRSPCYLQPGTPSKSMDVMAFTVVDTSLSNGKPYELRDLKDLPAEVLRKLASLSQSGEEDSPEMSTDESDCAYGMPVEQENENVNKFTRSKSENGTFAKRKDLAAETSSDHGNLNSGNAHSSPVGKRRRRLTACNKEASGQCVVSLNPPSSDTPEISENVHSQPKVSTTSSMESVEEGAQVNNWPLFDLNLPAEEVDFDFPKKNSDPQNAPAEHAKPMAEEEQVNLNSRRQSSRNRPPTTRALEAFARGFMSVLSRRGRGQSSRSRSRSYQNEGRDSGVDKSDAANGTSSNMSDNGDI